MVDTYSHTGQRGGAKKIKLINLHIRVDKETLDKLTLLAGSRKEPLASNVRRILIAGLNTEIAEQGLEIVTASVRKVIRSELKSTENRLAALGAKASISAGISEHMLTTLFERSIAGDVPEKRRQAKAIHDEARKKAVSGLKQQGGDEDS
jgi:2-iminoacetate synthase ThiH